MALRLQRPSKALLCIHGAGGSAPIYRVQTAKIRAALKNEFEFVYTNGPFQSAAGPGVLPLFSSLGPYYSWFREEEDGESGNDESTDVQSLASSEGNSSGNSSKRAKAKATSLGERVVAANQPVEKTIREWHEANPHTPIVGVVAFSEGALVASLLIWQQQMGRLPWFPRLSIALLVCCYHRDEATEYMRAESVHENDIRLDVPTLHLHGRQDFALERSRKLTALHYLPQSTEVLEFHGQHHFPGRKSEIDEAARRFMQLYSRNRLSV